MREYVGNTANLYLVETKDEKLSAQAEVILILSEPKYQPDGSGGYAKMRVNEEVRFSTSVKGLRILIKQLQVIEEEAQKLEDRASIEPEDKET